MVDMRDYIAMLKAQGASTGWFGIDAATGYIIAISGPCESYDDLCTGLERTFGAVLAKGTADYPPRFKISNVAQFVCTESKGEPPWPCVYSRKPGFGNLLTCDECGGIWDEAVRAGVEGSNHNKPGDQS